jgi:hypothetical protein
MVMLIDSKPAARQCDSASYGEVNRVAIIRVNERLTQ